jgi:hypothetical protein
MLRQIEHRGYRLVLGSVYPFDAHIPAPRLLAWYILGRIEPSASDGVRLELGAAGLVHTRPQRTRLHPRAA